MNKLPYGGPSDVKEQLKLLARFTNIPGYMLKSGSEKERDVISMMILYRHMDRCQRIEAMTAIHSLQNPALRSIIMSKIVDTALINPQWGIWSLSNSELINDIYVHEKIEEIAGFIGISASVLGGKDLIKDIFSLKKIGKKNWATIVIWGFVVLNKIELKRSKAELDSRRTLNSSEFYKGFLGLSSLYSSMLLFFSVFTILGMMLAIVSKMFYFIRFL